MPRHTDDPERSQGFNETLAGLRELQSGPAQSPGFSETLDGLREIQGRGVASNGTRPTTPEEGPGFLRRVGRGIRENLVEGLGRLPVKIGEAGIRAAEGPVRLVGQGDVADRLKATRQRMSAAVGEPETIAGRVVDVAAPVLAEGTELIAGGGGIRMIGREALERAAPRVAAGIASRRAARTGVRRVVAEAATDAAAFAPIDAAITAVGPENSVAGALAEVTGSETLEDIAANPVTRAAFETATGFVGDVAVRGIAGGVRRLARRNADQAVDAVKGGATDDDVIETVGSGSVGDSPIPVRETPDEQVTRALNVAEATDDIDPDEFVNVAKFALDPTGEVRLRDEVVNVVEEHGLAPKERVSHATTRRVASSLGLDPDKLAGKLTEATGRLGGAEMLSIRNVVSQNVRAADHISQQISKSVDEVGEPLTTEALDRLSRTLTALESQNDVLLSRFIKERSQTGRDLNNLKILANASMEPVTWLTRAQRLMGAPLPDAVKADIRGLVGANDRDGLVQYVAGLRQSPLTEKATTLWKAGLLSAPPTHMVNMISTGAMVTLEALKDVPATVYDTLLSTITKTRTKSFSLGDQATAAFRGANRGLKEARGAMLGMPTQETLRRWDVPHQVNFKSSILNGYTRFIFRSLGAEDRLFKGIVLERSMAEQARVLAKREGLKGADLDARIAALIEQPTDEMAIRAIEASELATFTNRGALGGMAASLKRTARQRSPFLSAAAEIAAPFSMTPSNVATRVAEFSPLGALSTVPDVVRIFKAAVEGKGVPEVQRKGCRASGALLGGLSSHPSRLRPLSARPNLARVP